MFLDHDLLSQGYFFSSSCFAFLILLLMDSQLQEREALLVESIRNRQLKVTQAREAIAHFREQIQTMSSLIDANTDAIIAAEEDLAAIRQEMSNVCPEGDSAEVEDPMAPSIDGELFVYDHDQSSAQQVGPMPVANMVCMDAALWRKDSLLECTVFWTNIPLAWTEYDLLDFMNTVGGTYPKDVNNVVAINVAYGPDRLGVRPEVAKGYALFLFASRALAEFAIQHVSNMLIDGKRPVLRFSDRPMDFRGRSGQRGRGRTRTGRYLWVCPEGPMDSRAVRH